MSIVSGSPDLEKAGPAYEGLQDPEHKLGVEGLQKSLPYEAVKSWVGSRNASLILSSMLDLQLKAQATAAETTGAATLPLFAAYQATHKKLPTSAAHMKTLGIPGSWLTWMEKSSDAFFIHFRIEQLNNQLGGAGFVPAEPPSSVANKAARKTATSLEEYKNLDRSLGKHTPVFLSYLIEKTFGAKSLTSTGTQGIVQGQVVG